MKTLPFILLFLIIGFSCTKKNNNNQFLLQAEKYMEAYPDSARNCLKQIIAPEKLPESQQALYALLWTQSTHKCHESFEGDSLINIAINYYTENKDNQRLARSLFYRGVIYELEKNITDAFESFSASEIAFQGIDDAKYLGLLYDHIGRIFWEQRIYIEALRYRKLTYQYKVRSSKPQYIACALKDIAITYRVFDELDSAKFYYLQALKYKEQIPDNFYAIILSEYAEIERIYENYDKAEKEQLEALQLLHDSLSILKNYFSLGTLYLDKKEYIKAKDYFLKILHCKDSQVLCGTFLQLSKVEKFLGNYQQAMLYNEQYKFYYDQLKQNRKTAEIATIPHIVKNEYLTKQNSRFTQKMTWIISLLSLMVIIVLYFVRILYKKHKTQKQLYENDKNKLYQQINTIKEENKMKYYNLNSQISTKKRLLEELDRKHKKEIEVLKEKTFELKKKNEDFHQIEIEKKKLSREKERIEVSLNELQKEFIALQERSREAEQYTEFLQNRGNIKSILLILAIKSGSLNNKLIIKREMFLPLLKEYLDFIHPEFYENINSYKLGEKKTLICCLLKLGITNLTVIAEATALSPESVKKYKKNILTKIYSDNEEFHLKITSAEI